MAKRKARKSRFTSRINVPVEPGLKQRINEAAGKYPGRPDPTKYARLVLENFVGKLPAFIPEE